MKADVKIALANEEMKRKVSELKRQTEDLESQARVNEIQALLEKADAEEAAIQQAEAEDAGLALPASPLPVPISTAASSVLPPPTLLLASPPASADVRPKFTSAATAAISTQNQYSQNNRGLRLVLDSIVERDSMANNGVTLQRPPPGLQAPLTSLLVQDRVWSTVCSACRGRQS